MSLENILSGQMVERIGWTLIHFLWQGAALAVILLVELALLRKSKANVRYIAACMTLALMALVPCVTVFVVPVSESGFESAGESRAATFGLETEYAEPVEVVTLTEAEPIVPENVAPAVTPAVAPVRPSYSWKERADGIFKSILPYLVLGWLVGVFGLSVWHLGGWAQLQRLRRRMVKPVGASLHSKLRELAELLGIHRAVQLMESALVRVPTVVGWLRPVILLPASALTGLMREQLEALLAHELAHIRRYDYLVNMLQTVVEILGFYHPAVWWVSHKIRVERENCCDDLAVRICGDKVRYAKALTSMEEIRGGRAGLAVAASGVSLLDRIRRLVGKGSGENKRCSWVPGVIVLLLILSLAIPTTLALTSRPEGGTDAEAEGASSAESKFTAVLSNGVTVELVGLYYGEGTKDVVFWKPDGSSFSDSEIQKYRERVVFPKWGNKDFRFEYGLMMRFVPLDELSAEVFVKQGQRMNYQYPRSDGIAIALVASDPHEREEGFLKVGHIKAAAAYGAWETRKWSARINEPSVLYLDEHSSIMLSPPRRTGERVDGHGYGGSSRPRKTDEWLVDVTVNAGNIDFDCFYESKDGSIHQAKWRGTLGHPKWIGPDQRTPMICKRYALPHEPEDREYIIIKYRRFEIVEFRNVSLKPGVKTDVEVDVGHAVPEVPSEPVKPGVPEVRRADEKTRKEQIAERLQNLEKQRNRVQRDLDVAEQGLEDIRRSSGFTDLDEQSHPHAITLRLNDLELVRNQLILQVQQLRAKIANLEKQKDGYTDAEVAGDPVVAMLTQELPRREAQLVARLAEFGKGHEKVQKIEEAINVIKKRLAARKAEIAEQVRQAELRKARDQLAVLSERLQELEKMRVEVAAKKRDLDEARVRYERRLAIRDERREMLDSIKEQIEKLKIIYDDPEPSPELVRVYEREDERGKAREARRLSKKEIAAKLKNLSNRRNNVQRDLQVVEHEMEDVRRSSGLTDLEERSYPHPVTSRVIRLERQRDDCVLEIAQLKAKIDNLQEKAGTAEGKGNLEKAQNDLVVLTRKLEQLEQMREEAAAKKRDLDLARVQYKQQLAIRDERKRMLDSLKSEIEKLRILHDDPETPKAKTEDKRR